MSKLTYTGQAIETKYLRPTNTKGGRIKAVCWDKTLTLPYRHDLTAEENHQAVALALASKIGRRRSVIAGATCTGYVFVSLPEEPTK